MTAWGIHRMADMIGTKDCQTGMESVARQVWVRAVPLPYTGNRIKAALAVLRGQAYAVEWPQAGELEKALSR
jgi:hypothetical protein